VWPPPGLAGSFAAITGIGLIKGLLQQLHHSQQQLEAAEAAAGGPVAGPGVLLLLFSCRPRHAWLGCLLAD